MKKNEKTKFYNTKGITLIALVITIIVLLILTGISISTLTGSGLFNKTKDAKLADEIAREKEQIKLTVMSSFLIGENYINGIPYNDFYEEFTKGYGTEAKVSGISDESKIPNNATLISLLEKVLISEVYAAEEEYPYAKVEYNNTGNKYYVCLQKGQKNKVGDVLADPSNEDPEKPTEPEKPAIVGDNSQVEYYTYSLIDSTKNTSYSNYYKYLVENKYYGYEITGFSEKGKAAMNDGVVNKLIIPTTYNNQPVVGIAENAFLIYNDNYGNIEKMVVQSSIKAIDHCSLGCARIYDEYNVELEIQEGLEYLDYEPFDGMCDNKKCIRLPDSVRYVDGSLNSYYSRYIFSIGQNLQQIPEYFNGSYDYSVVFYRGTIEDLRKDDCLSNYKFTDYEYGNSKDYTNYVKRYVYCLEDGKKAYQIDNPDYNDESASKGYRYNWSTCENDKIDTEALSFETFGLKAFASNN